MDEAKPLLSHLVKVLDPDGPTTLFPKGKSFLINLIELINYWEGEAKEGKAIEEFAGYKDSSLQL